MGRQAVVDRLYEHVISLRRYALLLTRSPQEAEDLVQECLTRAIAAAHSWEPGTDLRAWLFRILHNAHVSAIRKQQVRDTAQLDLPSPVVEASQVVQMEVKQVLAALQQLPESQRQAIVLVALDNMKYEDAARSLDIPIGTFMSRLARGREALRQIMEGVRKPRLRLIGGGR